MSKTTVPAVHGGSKSIGEASTFGYMPSGVQLMITLGAALVLCFSIGLALTMVASGVLAALSVKHVSRRWSGFGDFARKAPYFSGGLIALVGLYVGWQGVQGVMQLT